MASPLTISQMYALARRAGLSPADAVTAAAVGMAESSGRPAVTSANPDGGTNVGVWQLDTPGGMGAGYSVSQLQDPWTNAQAMAKATKDGQDWSAWQTYADGTYNDFMPQATQVMTSEQGSSGSGGSWIDSVLHGVDSAWNDTGGKVVSAVGQAAGGAAGLFSGASGLFSDAEKFLHAAMWLMNPANWMRIIAGFFGVLLAGAGIFMVAKAA